MNQTSEQKSLFLELGTNRRLAHHVLFGHRHPLATWPQHCGWRTEPDVGRVAYGVPARVAKLRALGNAIVPQVAAEFIKAVNL